METHLEDDNYFVYVDAKIENRHTKTPKQAFVGYVVPNMKELRRFKPVDAKETHEVEYQAILFAILELKDRLKRFTVFCDNKSVVDEVLRESKDGSKANPYLTKIRNELANSNIRLKWFEKNPAHALLNEYVRQRNLV